MYMHWKDQTAFPVNTIPAARPNSNLQLGVISTFLGAKSFLVVTGKYTLCYLAGSSIHTYHYACSNFFLETYFVFKAAVHQPTPVSFLM